MAFALIANFAAADDLSKAAVIMKPGAARVATAAQMLIEEVEKRSGVRVVYAGDQSTQNAPTLRLRTDDGAELHGYMPKPFPPRPQAYVVPRASTRDGALTMIWNQEPGRGGAGRSCQVAEVWLEPVK